MGKARNVLFIMCDQLRADYLGCMGHPSLRTPHIDALARRGVTFTRAYCQAPVCGPSRMSFYTGRYMFCHGANYNGVPLRVDEWTLGDYLRDCGLRVGLVGKTHFAPDRESLERLGLVADAPAAALLRECGFEPWERDDGLHPDLFTDRELPYNRYLRSQGYEGDNPWHTVANAAQGPDGRILSGWHMRHARLPARVDKAHSETAYMTDLAMRTIDLLKDQPWCLHLSYIKPHWPYIAPAPYHAMYGDDDLLAANRSETERESAHPVVAAFMRHEESVNFSREEVRRTVIPAYMGLISEIDDHVGRLVAFLDARGRLDDTLIVFTSDHGDYLGDHWLGDKELFHEESVRIPLIVVDPDAAAERTRGTLDDRLVEAIDLVPTLIDAMGGRIPHQRLEGRSLLPLLHACPAGEWRDAVFSELDYAWRPARRELGLRPDEARVFMIRTQKWKFVLYENFRPQLFDLDGDPQERTDLGDASGCAAVRDELEGRIGQWLRQRRLRVTISDEAVEALTGTAKQRGILYGVW